MGGLLNRYPRGPAYDNVRGGWPAAPAYAGAVRRSADAHRRGPGAPCGGQGSQLPRPGRRVFHAGEGWLFPLDLIPRLIPAASRRGDWSKQPSCSGYAPLSISRRCLRAGRGGPGQGGASFAAHHLRLYEQVAHRAAERCAGPPRQNPISSVTRQAYCGSSRTTCKCRPACPTWWRTAGPWPGSSPACSWSRKYGRSPPIQDGCSTRCGGPRPLVPGAGRGAAHPGVGNAAYFGARFPGPQDGHRAGRGPGPVIPRQRSCICAASEGGEQVDVLYRRVNNLSIRSNSGPTRWWDARGSSTSRQGNVTIANAVGNGVADDKLTYTYLPELINTWASVPVAKRHDLQARRSGRAVAVPSPA